MTVLVDVTTGQHAVGIGIVAGGFLEGLAEAECRRDVVVAAGPHTNVRAGIQVRHVAMARTRVGRLCFQRLLLPTYARAIRGSVGPVGGILLLDAYAPLIGRASAPTTAFVHDVLPLTNGDYWSSPRRLVKSLAFASVRWQNLKLLTSSKYNAELVHQHLGMDATPIRFGCGQLSDEEADDFLRKGPRPRAKHVLYIGAIDERKNIHRLVEAFKFAKPTLPADVRLVLVGRPRERYGEQIVSSVRSLQQSNRIELRDNVSRSEAVELIATAAALVFPSHAEGFGLPVLEALAVGTPVVASDIPAIRSWAGAAALYAPSSDPHAMASAIEVAVRGAGPRPGDGQELAAQYRWRSFADAAVAHSTTPKGM